MRLVSRRIASIATTGGNQQRESHCNVPRYSGSSRHTERTTRFVAGSGTGTFRRVRRKRLYCPSSPRRFIGPYCTLPSTERRVFLSNRHPSTMRVTLDRIDANFYFRGRNKDGAETFFDLGTKEGGTGKAPGAMQTVAMALGACSAVDVVMILRKARQEIEHLHIDIDYERAKDQTPAVFTNIHVHYSLDGELDPKKVKRAVQLSIEKYCSVSAMLRKTATIEYSFSVNGTRYD